MRSQPTASRQSPGWEPDSEFDGRMDSCLAVEVAADRKRNKRRLLPVIGAVWAHETTPDARRGVDGWTAQGPMLQGFKDEFRQRQRQPEARLVRAKRFGLISTGDDWYDSGWKDSGSRVCGWVYWVKV
ncbi:hypothetical protein V6N13_137425 [Hibiscus sabdariffa]|uniref:Uncharacterized protein n=1 Tax=Hibiscus sabdariffa TaxID=183260 RepID=A0ABR2DM85_9ROSI